LIANDNNITRPITTYGGRGTLKTGLDQGQHAIIYMQGQAPARLAAETGMVKEPLQVIPARNQKLSPMSRVNFAKMYTVEHNVKVMDVGKVSQDSLPKLIGYWRVAVGDI
jgi:hypothetical protein